MQLKFMQFKIINCINGTHVLLLHVDITMFSDIIGTFRLLTLTKSFDG